MLGYFEVPIGWGDLINRTIKETRDDNGLGLAAQLAYYFFLALFPALLFLISWASFVSGGHLVDEVVGMLGDVAPPAVIEIIRTQLRSLSEHRSAGILTFGVAAALWSSSAAMVGLIDALNRAYDVEEERPWWKRRLVAILLTLGVSIFVLAATALVISGPQLAEWISSRVGWGAAFRWSWTILQWPLIFVLIATAVGLIYYFAPHVDQDFIWLTPGSVLATALWLLGSLAFRLYVINFGSYNATYGTIGGVMVLMLWLYLSGLVIVIGAEMNSEIDHALPHGRAPGEKAPGAPKKIGPRAARDFEHRRRRGAARETIRPIPPQTQRGRAAARTTALMTGILAALFGRRVK